MLYGGFSDAKLKMTRTRPHVPIEMRDIFASHNANALSPSPKHSVEVEGGANQCQVSEGLWEVA
jgi:hypothetical protein